MARVIAPVATMLNPELAVIGGAVAKSVGVRVADIADRLPQFTSTPPRLAVSTPGEAIVSTGAVRHALGYVEEHALDLHPKNLH